MIRSKVESASLAETAYAAIRDGILRGQRPLGSPLSRRQLAAELKMSVVPVADALQRLENEGLIESRPRVGTRVRVPSAQDVRGHYVVREALESQSARLFAERATAEERDEIKRMAARLDAMYADYADETHSPEEWFRLHQEHLRFHMRVAECCGYEALCAAIQRNQILIFNWLYDTAAGRRTMPPNHHGRLAKSLCSQDPLVADKSMRLHVAHGRDEVLATLEKLTSK